MIYHWPWNKNWKNARDHDKYNIRPNVTINCSCGSLLRLWGLLRLVWGWNANLPKYLPKWGLWRCWLRDRKRSQLSKLQRPSLSRLARKFLKFFDFYQLSWCFCGKESETFILWSPNLFLREANDWVTHKELVQLRWRSAGDQPTSMNGHLWIFIE